MNEGVTDPLVRLEMALPNLQGAVDQQHLGNALSAAVAACGDMPQRIARLESLATALSLLPGYLSQRRADIKAAIEEILELGEAMEGAANPTDLDAIGKDVRKLDQQLSQIHRSALALVEAYSREFVAPLGALEKLLRKLGRDAVANAIAELTIIERGLASAGHALPDKLKQLLDARAALARDLTTLASDPEVDAFLTAFAKKGSVTLDVVTQRVLKWLADQSALDQFNVQAID